MRNEELYETINEALSFLQSNLHTNVVCKVTAVNEKTISCKPVTNRVVGGVSKELPDFIEVPPIFMSGGSSYMAHPISVGDYCLLFIAERCFDAWFGGDDFVSPVEMRMHDYSDGFALVGIQNKAGAITIPDVTALVGDMTAEGNWVHEGDLEQTGDQVTTGKIESTVSVTAPILEGVLTGVGGAPPVIPQSVTATEIHAQNGFTGTKIAASISFVFVDGILIS